jgi:hypothetical protein
MNYLEVNKMKNKEIAEDFINVLKNMDDVDVEISRCILKLKNFKTIYPDEASLPEFEDRTENTINYMIQKLNDSVEILENTKIKVHKR